MKWYHWVILVCAGVAGLLVWFYMLGSKEDVNKKMEAVRAAKAAKNFEALETEIEKEAIELTKDEPTV